jgi:glyoxylase-like metal-dependent hydrolase (beta-lactamase superfamily II)
MAKPTQRVIGRGERVQPGIWRLRLPLPWPGVPHCNAWAIAAGDGVVLVDTGVHEAGSMAHLERALEQVGLRVEHVRLVVCTHAHADHCGEAATIAERAGCEVWMHPRSDHLFKAAADPEAALARRVEVARASGVPEEPLRRWWEQRARSGPLVKLPLDVDRELVPGVIVETDLGPWQVIETPGHAPSHVCLHQPDRRLLLSGDHVLGRVSLHFDMGFSDDPVGEFLDSLDRVERLDVRLALSGHGRPFTDVPGHVGASRELVRERLDAVLAAMAGGPLSAYDITPRVFGEAFGAATGPFLFSEVLAYLMLLERTGRSRRLEPAATGGSELWSAT